MKCLIRIIRYPQGSYPFKPSKNPNEYSMIWNIEDALYYLCSNYLSYEIEINCNCRNSKKSSTCVYFSCNLIDPNRSICNIFKNDLHNTLLTRFKVNQNCSYCNTNINAIKSDYSDMIFIRVYLGSNEDTVPLEIISTLITVNEDDYVLKFIVHFDYMGDEEYSINHYVCYAYNEIEKKYSYIDDLSRKDEGLRNVSHIQVYPTLICYFKK